MGAYLYRQLCVPCPAQPWLSQKCSNWGQFLHEILYALYISLVLCIILYISFPNWQYKSQWIWVGGLSIPLSVWLTYVALRINYFLRRDYDRIGSKVPHGARIITVDMEGTHGEGTPGMYSGVCETYSISVSAFGNVKWFVQKVDFKTQDSGDKSKFSVKEECEDESTFTYWLVLDGVKLTEFRNQDDEKGSRKNAYDAIDVLVKSWNERVAASV